MKSIIETYAGIILLTMLLAVCIGFTSINLCVVDARKVYSNYTDLIQETDGAILTNGQLVTSSGKAFVFDAASGTYILYYNMHKDGTGKEIIDDTSKPVYYKVVVKKTNTNTGGGGQTFIYNDVYEVNLVYTYNVMLFGQQVYRISGTAL